MPTAAKFPATALALADVGGEVVNFGELVLNTTITSGSTSIVASSAIPSSWPQVGFIAIDAEIIKHTSWAGSTFTTVAAPNGRGFDGTTAAGHTAGAAIKMTDTALRFNQAIAEIIAIEASLLSGIQRAILPLNLLFPSAAIDIVMARVPGSGTVSKIYAYLKGGTAAVVNVRKNGSLALRSADLSLAVGSWTDFGTLQNAAVVAGDLLEFRVISTAGSPEQLAVQVELT